MPAGPSLRQNWFLDIQGKKEGPYTVEQIRDLLYQGQLAPDIKATNLAWEARRQIGVRELIDTYFGAKEKEVDPALSLFDTLQVAREKNAVARHSSQLPANASSNASHFPEPAWTAPPQASVHVPWKLYALVFLLLFFAGVWFFNRSERPASSGSVATEASGVPEQASRNSTAGSPQGSGSVSQGTSHTLRLTPTQPQSGGTTVGSGPGSDDAEHAHQSNDARDERDEANHDRDRERDEPSIPAYAPAPPPENVEQPPAEPVNPPSE